MEIKKITNSTKRRICNFQIIFNLTLSYTMENEIKPICGTLAR